MPREVQRRLSPGEIQSALNSGLKARAMDVKERLDVSERILDAAKPHEIDWKWVRGHSGNPMNERADVLATEARRTLGGG